MQWIDIVEMHQVPSLQLPKKECYLFSDLLHDNIWAMSRVNLSTGFATS